MNLEQIDTSAVAIVCDGWDIRYIGSGPISPLIKAHGVEIGTKLVTQDRLLAALERASACESALRRLADESDNEITPGWEGRMRSAIDHANTVLAREGESNES